jgi:signal transduction histidine kinase
MRTSPAAPSAPAESGQPGESPVASGKPLDLLRYFTGSALAVVLVTTAALASASAWLVHRSFLDIERDEADSIAEELVSDLRASGYGLERWGTASVPGAVRDATLGQMRNFGLTELTLYSLAGGALEDFATESAGTRPFWQEGFDRAGSGETTLRWERTYGGGIPWFRAAGGGFVESYAPVRDRGGIVAVARVRRNEAPNLAKAEEALPLLIGCAFASGLLVFGALWLLVFKADSILRRQYRDILEAQSALARKNTLLAALNRRKDEFYAMCSHDLRTPLVSVQAGCRLLLAEEGSSARRRDVIVENLRNASVVLDLVDNLLDLARIEDREDRLESASLDLRRIVEGVVAANRSYAESRGVWLELETPGECVLVNGDRLKLVRILNNLVSNAIKHAEGKPVTVALEQSASGPRILVRDRGAGLRPDVRADLMAGRDPARPRGAGGGEDSHGLGLSIVRRLVTLHGGRLHVRANRDAGTVFVVELPPAA